MMLMRMIILIFCVDKVMIQHCYEELQEIITALVHQQIEDPFSTLISHLLLYQPLAQAITVSLLVELLQMLDQLDPRIGPP